MSNRNFSSDYSGTAKAIHWLMAVLIFLLLTSGFSIYFELIQYESLLFRLYQWHKSLGVIALCLIILRIVWRKSNKPPRLKLLTLQQQSHAQKGHLALYCLMLLTPLSGWVFVSTSLTGVPTIVFNTFIFPHLPLPANETVSSLANDLHLIFAILLLTLICGHLFFVIRHQQLGDNVLTRITPKTRISYIALGLFFITLPLLGLKNQSNIILTTDDNKSYLNFSGTHTDNVFNGEFLSWQLNTNLFDGEVSNNSHKPRHLSLVIDTKSAFTNNDFYDETLQEVDWFNTRQYPQIKFKSETIEEISATEVSVKGFLTIKATRKPFTLILTKSASSLSAELNLSRLAWGIGIASDPDAEWVADLIKINAKWNSNHPPKIIDITP